MKSPGSPDGRSPASQTKRGSIEENEALIEARITDLLRTSGADRVNILAHSKGGLESRLYILDHPGQVDKLVMLGTPNAGTKLADIGCGFNHQILGIPTNPIGALVKSQYGDCNGPQDGLYQLKTSYVQKTFNKNVPDRGGVFYGTIAGAKSTGLGFLLDDADNDSFVTVPSVEHLSRYDPAQRGLHEPLDVFNVNHSGLLDAASRPGNGRCASTTREPAVRRHNRRTPPSRRPRRPRAPRSRPLQARP